MEAYNRGYRAILDNGYWTTYWVIALYTWKRYVFYLGFFFPKYEFTLKNSTFSRVSSS